MIPDKLYELAFAYKKTKLWDKIWKDQLFAVKLTDGKMGYVCAERGVESAYALKLFTTQKGLDTYRTLASSNVDFMPQRELYDLMLRQECLECVWLSKNDLEEDELEEVRTFTREHGIKLAGSNAYPSFSKRSAYYFPWYLKDRQEQEYMCQALEAAVVMSGLLKGHTPEELGFSYISEDTKTVPMLEKVDGTYVLGKSDLPKPSDTPYPVPKMINDIHVAKLKKMKKVGIWECEILYFPEPVVVPKEEIPIFPAVILAVDKSTEYILPVSPVEHYEENPEALVDVFMEAFLMQKVCPAELIVRDERTYAFAEQLCQRLGIPVGIGDNMETLNMARYEFLEHFSASEEERTADILDMLDEFLELDEEQLRTIPDEIAELLRILAGHPEVPEEAQEKLNRVISIIDGDESIRNTHVVRPNFKNMSYVISVSLWKGCYRHIQISADSTLEELHDVIRESYGFDNDHCYAFFMDNKFWSREDAYFSDDMEKGEQVTARYRLYETGLRKDKQFKYLYDFGDEWRFQCKVLRIVEEATPEPVVIRSKGEAPDQYEDWEDE